MFSDTLRLPFCESLGRERRRPRIPAFAVAYPRSAWRSRCLFEYGASSRCCSFGTASSADSVGVVFGHENKQVAQHVMHGTDLLLRLREGTEYVPGNHRTDVVDLADPDAPQASTAAA